jgi:hypothetical protein
VAPLSISSRAISIYPPSTQLWSAVGWKKSVRVTHINPCFDLNEVSDGLEFPRINRQQKVWPPASRISVLGASVHVWGYQAVHFAGGAYELVDVIKLEEVGEHEN